MTQSHDAKPLGHSSSPLEVSGAGAQTLVRLEPAAHRELIARLTGPGAEPARQRIYLQLEDIQGSFDATALRVYVGLPQENPAEAARPPVGSVGLYGLRRASLPNDESSGEGLTSILDVTENILALPLAHLSGARDLNVRLVPSHPLPADTTITVGRISIRWEAF